MVSPSFGPVFKVNVGVPVTATASLNVTLTSTVLPIFFVPSPVSEVTPETVAWEPSISKVLAWPREPAFPGVTNVKSVLFSIVMVLLLLTLIIFVLSLYKN